MIVIDQLLNSIFPVAQFPVAHAAEAARGSVTDLFGLNWKLFLAQLVNFGIILFVLWKWVFGPLGEKLEERRGKIEQSIAKSREIEELHAAVVQQSAEQIGKARNEATEIIGRARNEAIQVKDIILADAKKQADGILSQQRKVIEQEKLKMNAEVKEQAAALVVLALEKILRQKIDQKKDQELINEALKQL